MIKIAFRKTILIIFSLLILLFMVRKVNDVLITLSKGQHHNSVVEIDNWILPWHSSRNSTISLVPESNCSMPFVTIGNSGRLGNNICELSSLLVMRLEFGIRVVVSKQMHRTLKRLFEAIPAPHLPNYCFDRQNKPIKLSFTEIFEIFKKENESLMLHNSKHYFIEQIPCPTSLLLKHREEFQSILKPRTNFVEKAKKRIKIALTEKNLSMGSLTLISAHIRRVDYINYVKKRNITFPTEKFYKAAFKFYRKYCGNVAFVVVSDDLKWAEEKLSDLDVIFPGSGKIGAPQLDFTLLSVCHHHIVGLGSFGFTSAFLGEGSSLVFKARANNNMKEEDILSGLLNRSFSCRSSEFIFV